MKYYLRPVFLSILFVGFSTFLWGESAKEPNKPLPELPSDSSIQLQLRYIDSLSTFKIEEAKESLDSLMLLTRENPKYFLKLVLKKSKLLSLLSQHNEAIVFLKSVISRGYKEPDIYYALAKEYRTNQEYSMSISASQKAILLYQSLGDNKGVADATNYLIQTYGTLGMFDEARKYFSKNIRLCNKINYDNGLLNAYMQYGESYVFANPNLAFELLQTGKKIASSIGVEEGCIIDVFLLRYYINTNQINKAKSEIKKFIQKCGQLNQQRESNVYTLMAYVYTLENNYDSAIYYNKKALKRRKVNGNQKMIANSYLNLAGDYLENNQAEIANRYLNQAEKIVFGLHNPEMLLTYYKNKIKYFNFVRDYKSAFQLSQKMMALNQELINKRHQDVLSKLNTSFEIQQKNVLLQNELNRRKANGQRLGLIFVSLLLIAGLAYLIYLNRNKKLSYQRLISKTDSIEKKLVISNKERTKFQSIFDYSVTGILILDKNGIIKYANPKSITLLGQENSAILRIPFADFFVGENKSNVEKSLLNVFMEHQADSGLKVQVFRRKLFNWLDISFAPLIIEKEDDNILVTLIDVTQEINNRYRETEQKKELQTLINSVLESILFIQPNGKIRAFNNTAMIRLDRSAEELSSSNYFDVIPKRVRKNRTEMFEQVAKTKEPLIEIETVGPYNNLVSMYPNINAKGEVDYISEFVQDISERKKAEEQIDNLKQRVLRSQMNPHFIFNSLTSIQSFVLRNDAAMASKYLNSFARLIRLILESSRYDLISLKDEISILKYYLEIQEMRFSNKFTFHFEVDPELDLEQIKIPPMIAQPFIENSIEHGIQHLDKMGELHIRLIKEGSRMLFELRDNGIGREASQILNKENVFASKSVSTKIVNDRITALNKYAKEVISYNIVDLKDENNQAIGTQVLISIPIGIF
jgi:PAS domain S-box-containing protein